MHDSYALYHRDPFLDLLPPPGRLTLDIGCGEARLLRDRDRRLLPPPVRYRDTVERDGLAVTFESEHRPIGWYFEALTAAGFVVERLREVAVPDEAVGAPRHLRWQRLPIFLHIRAIRP